MAQVYTFTDANGEIRLMAEINPAPGGSPSVLAIVERSGGSISDWDGTNVAYDTVTFDPDALWSAVAKQFTIVAPGWYLVTTANGAIEAPAAANDGSHSVTALVFGAGENINVIVNNHTAVATGSWAFPHITGYTHLDAGDGIAITGGGGTGWTVSNGAVFAIQLVVAD